MTKSPNLIILGAGAPHRGELPAALREPRSGTSMLQWLLDASSCAAEETIFVAGYQAEAIRARYPELPVVENSDWEYTGSGASLLAAPFSAEQPLLVCYSDILFRETVPAALAAVEADIAVAWDSAWEHRYAGRGTDDLRRCEKVMVNGDRVERLGADLPLDWADGEFIGLVWFSSRALAWLEELRESGPESLRRRHLSEYIEYLRAAGLSVAAVDVAGDWAEFNEPRDIAHFILGTKAETLSRLQGMVCNAVIQDQVACTVAEWRAEPEAVLGRVRERFAEQRLVVRSSARSEDSFHASNAGGYDSVLNVDPMTGLAEAVARVVASYGEAVTDDDQVLIQPMVPDVRLSGVAFTRTLEHGAPWYVVNYETSGDTEAITSGASGDHHTLLLRREAGEAPPQLGALVAALREIEGLLGYDALDVEFAVDGAGTVHILQVRPIAVDAKGNELDDDAFDTAMASAHHAWQTLAPAPPHLPGDAPPLFGVMPDWNPAEIIGTAPGALAASLYRYLVMDEVWAVQRAEYGYRDVRPAPLLATFAGHPYVDVRASFASFLPASLPDALAGRLLNFYLDWLRERPELHDKVEFEVVPTCLAPGFEGWERRLRDAGGFSAEEVAQLREGLRAITARAFERCDADLARIDALGRRFDALMADDRLVPLERARLLLDDCRRLGTLPFAHLARSGFVAVTLLREAEACGIISGEARESFLSTVHTVSHELTADARAAADGAMEWAAFVARYGHLRPGTYDITSPRYDADPERFLRPLVEHAREATLEEAEPGPWQAERTAFSAALGELGLPCEPELVERFLRRAIEGREYAKFVFSRNLSAALEALAEVGAAYGLDREQVGDLPLDELLALRTTARSGEAIAGHLRLRAEEEAEARRLAAACELPPLLTREAELDAFVIGADRPNFIGSGTVTADCLDLSEHPADTALEVAGRIVLIPQADPGYDWLFGQGIAGLVTLYGGANSHMAIRAAEFGLPAAIGIGDQRYRELARARVLELSPVNGLLRVVR
ncbi:MULTISPECIES: PEP/pyruvate-binding domain-containing protein [unclassified Halorhodospira]|uniref:PEP/pyruvate-binding domain-containing protein n=1 Tax=unclassified Halorhodospira TaxID=2626748 RepID=UPI001EE7964B|nr:MULTISPECIES: PEP/pyruvate-binding domain-containing protein [unclassified Halorhodospira]MCG5541849.1 NTP transferase domain-containing protein [Halorhodospira sp. M39old]MCG5546919.1 NTP transferase domain-containing protein [Halorhodospira sp. M38]